MSCFDVFYVRLPFEHYFLFQVDFGYDASTPLDSRFKKCSKSPIETPHASVSLRLKSSSMVRIANCPVMKGFDAFCSNISSSDKYLADMFRPVAAPNISMISPGVLRS